jgi:hypothetical protein
MEDSAGSRRVLPATVSCRLDELPLSESSRRTAAFRRWRHCVDDLGCPALAVPAADLGDRGHVRSVVCGAPCSHSACRGSCSRRGDPRPAGAAEGGEAVSGDGSGHAGDITDHGGGGVLELRSAFPRVPCRGPLGIRTVRDQGRWWTANAQRPAGTHRHAGALDRQVEGRDTAGRRAA